LYAARLPSSIFSCASLTEGPLLGLPAFRKRSLIPLPPVPPMPKATKPIPNASARKTNIHFAWRRSLGKNIADSTPLYSGRVLGRLLAGERAPLCGLVGRCFRRAPDLAIRS
jgi:hypothetical protein